MKQEDIEKAAINYCYENAIVSDSWDIEIYKDGFQDGAKWRINSIWHNIRENPGTSKEIIVTYSDKSCKIFRPIGIWETLIEVDKFIRWAYVEDLLPNNEN